MWSGSSASPWLSSLVDKGRIPMCRARFGRPCLGSPAGAVGMRYARGVSGYFKHTGLTRARLAIRAMCYQEWPPDMSPFQDARTNNRLRMRTVFKHATCHVHAMRIMQAYTGYPTQHLGSYVQDLGYPRNNKENMPDCLRVSHTPRWWQQVLT